MRRPRDLSHAATHAETPCWLRERGKRCGEQYARTDQLPSSLDLNHAPSLVSATESKKSLRANDSFGSAG